MRNQSYKWQLAILALGILLVATSMKVVNAGPPVQFGGWVTYWDFKRGMETVQQGKGIYRDIFLFSTQLDVGGKPIILHSATNDYRSAINQLKNAGMKTWMTFVNDVKSTDGKRSILKDSQIVHKILSDEDLRRKHRREIVDLALEYGVSGVDIDYENLLPEDRIYFSRFISELSPELKKRNLSLSVTVQPKTVNRPTPGSGTMDWSEICRHADRLQIMLYNQHNKKTGPGPMATVDWISEVLGYAKSQCELETIVPILKVSGMHWRPNKVTALQYDEIVALKNRHKPLLERETTSQVPFFSYKTNEETGTVYYEDALSLKTKIHQILAMGFDNLVFWSLGRQDPHLTSELKNLLKTFQVKTGSQ